MKHFFRLLIILTAFGTLVACSQQESHYAYVTDDADVLTPEQTASLSSEMEDLEKRIGVQMAIKIIDSLNDESIEDFSMNLATAMSLGRDDFADGLLITVSIKEKQIRIEVGEGLKGIIKDEIAARIIRYEMGPLFREEKYYDGLLVAVQEMKGLITTNTGLIGKPIK